MTTLADLQIDEGRFRRLIALAFEEDLGQCGDLTTIAVSGPPSAVSQECIAELIAMADGVICGLAIVPFIVDWAPPAVGRITPTTDESREEQGPGAPRARVVPDMPSAQTPCSAADLPVTFIMGSVSDGDGVTAGTVLGTLRGDRAALLVIERTLLNFVQHLSGVATLTRKFVDAVQATGAKIHDTRKTTPGWRDLEKYAVRCGGGHNHRRGLYDAVLVKDNHLAGVELPRLAVFAFEILNRAAELKLRPAFVGFEVDTLDQFEELLKVVGIDVILLDNFSPEDMSTAVRRRDELGLKGKLELEASGGITLETIGAIAQTGIERISLGALTHSAASLDISLQL